MSTKYVNTTSSGGGFFSLLQVAFIVLKLVGTIDWPWVWVLAPTWIPMLILLVVLAVFAIFYFIADSKK